MVIARIRIGWGWLERTLNSIIDAINANQPLPSASIAVEQSPNGTVLKVVKSKDQQPPQGGGGGGAGSVVWHGVAWQSVTVVDPANNCAQSQIKVLIVSPGSQIQIQ